MRLNLEDLRLRGGQSHVREASVEVAPISVGGADFDVVVPGGVIISIDRIAGGYLVKLALDAKVCGPCFRCLGEVCEEVHAEQEEFIPAVAGAWAETESETTPFVEDLVIDLAGLTREAIILSLPDKMLCSEDCKGLCPVCGADLNKTACSCVALEE